MARRASEAKRSEWVARVSRQASSGQSVSAFCKKELVSESNFYHWMRRLKDDRGSTRSSSKRVGSTRASATRQFVQLHTAPIAGSAPVEFTMANGTLIRIPSDQVAAVEVVAKAFAARCNASGGHADA